ncbi:uncharacterized protein LOC121411524 isoform X2 [Lytechinus variegatus]|uniref:uncharacterized protein LOC121411524 isoform X2 n=1 Tax=Lytechinus variegatus TaxID=7654 RepID=UPI001BB206F9|nr:uncharacterized protein LOC121411524 isoform X2 [Lytechinus variegatus]
MMETDLAFFLGYVVMTIVATRFRYVLSLKKLLHLTYRLFYSSLFFKTVCLLLLNIDLSRFARTGLEMTKMQDAAEVFSWLSTVFFVCVLLLVSKGFSITRAQISLPGTVKTICFGFIYLTFYTIVFFDQRVLLDPQDIIVSMTSLSASGLIGLKFTGAIIFVHGCIVTIKNHPRKVPFYLPFTIFFSVWFVAEPTYRLLYLYVYPVLKSPNIWNGIDLALCFTGHAYFLYITRPDRLNKRFPFHLRAGKVSFRDNDEDVEDLYIPSKDFYSIFQTGKKSDSGSGTTLTIPEGPQHYQTPVLPFNTPSEECLAVLLRPSLPEIPTVSATVDLSYRIPSPEIPTVSANVDPAYRIPSPVIPTVSGTFQKQTPATSSVFVSMPSVVARQSKKITPTGSSTGQKQFPNEDGAADEISTASVPKGGFSIFSVQKQPLAAPKGGYSIFSVNKQPDTLTSSRNSGTDVTDQTEMYTSVNKEQPSRNNDYSFLPKIAPSIESTVSSSPKTSKESGSDVQLTDLPLEILPAACKPNQEPLKTKVPWESVSEEKVLETRVAENLKQIAIKPSDDSNLDKDIDESRCFTESISQVNGVASKARIINVLPAQEPTLQIMTLEETKSDSALPDIQSQNNGDHPNVRVINVKPLNEPYLNITSTRESRSINQTVRNGSSTDASTNACLITVRPASEPLNSRANVVSVARIQKVFDATTEAVPDIKSLSDDITVAAPKPSSLETNDMLEIKITGPLIDPLKHQFPVPRPKIQNWTTEPLKQPNDLLTNVGQGEVFENNLFDPDNGRPSCQKQPDNDESRSENIVTAPAINGGDFAKPCKKTRKEPSQRRFPKSTNLGMTSDISSNNQPMAMDPKTKKKKLKRFLKLARRHNNKPAKAE